MRLIREPALWFKLILLLGIIGLGAFFRFYQIENLPPGDSHDPAQYGVDALQILGGARPIYLPENYGREAMFSYLVAGIYLVTGPGALGIHLASALVGLATLPALFWAGEEIFYKDDNPLVHRYGALLATFLLAISYWHLNYSRVGLRAILVPLFVCLAVAALVRGLRRESRPWLVIAGLFVGLSGYTYQAARLLPLLVLGVFLLVGLSRQRPWRQLALDWLVVNGVALLMFAPMVWYEVQNPGALNERVNEAALWDETRPWQEQLPEIIDYAQESLLTFSFTGDSDPLFSLPGRPTLDLFLSLAFYTGIGLALIRFQPTIDLLLLGWLATFLAPALIADQAATAKRAIGALPAVVLLTAVGMLGTLYWLNYWRKHSTAPPMRRAFWGVLLVTAVGLGFSGYRTYEDYFVIWGTDPGLNTHFQLKRTAVGTYLATLPPDEQIYLSPLSPNHPTIRLHSGLREDVVGYNGRFCLVLPRTEKATTYVIAPDVNEKSLDHLRRHFPAGDIIAEAPSSTGSDQPDYIAYRVPAGASRHNIPGQWPQPVWNNSIRLLGVQTDHTDVQPGETIVLNLYYRAEAPMAEPYTAFVHLLGAEQVLWAQSDHEPCQGGYPTQVWQLGEIIHDTVALTVPADAPQGKYTLVTGFYEWPSLARLPLVDGDEQPRPNTTHRLLTLNVVDLSERQ